MGAAVVIAYADGKQGSVLEYTAYAIRRQQVTISQSPIMSFNIIARIAISPSYYQRYQIKRFCIIFMGFCEFDFYAVYFVFTVFQYGF